MYVCNKRFPCSQLFPKKISIYTFILKTLKDSHKKFEYKDTFVHKIYYKLFFNWSTPTTSASVHYDVSTISKNDVFLVSKAF